MVLSVRPRILNSPFSLSSAMSLVFSDVIDRCGAVMMSVFSFESSTCTCGIGVYH